jgi:tRNA (guanine37-N1)-methyltransferase
MKFKVLTIFPDFFEKAVDFSLLKRARDKGIIEVEIYDLREFAKPRQVHKMVDDRPYGGGPGMVMMVEPVYRALRALKVSDIRYQTSDKESSMFNDQSSESPKELKVATSDVVEGSRLKTLTVIFSPKGKVYNQPLAEKIAADYDEVIIIVPHYEGFDERILTWVDMEICIGDFVLTGGEIPALAVIDSVSRLLPGFVGNEDSIKTESFSELKNGDRNLEHAQYTRPEVFIDDEGKEHRVPDVLLSGHHKKIENWKSSK